VTTPVHILVGVVFRDAMATLGAALDSLLQQRCGAFRASVLLVDDASRDGWRDALGARLRHPTLHIRHVTLRSAAAARNFVLDEVDRSFGDVDYVARLDADDTLHGPEVLRELAERLREGRPDVLVAGNVQRRGGVVLAAPNRATSELLDPARLLGRLERMAAGDASAELPSCNAVVRRGLPHRYPMVHSAEDHWYLTALLLDQQRLRVHVAPDLLYAVYGLRGGLTLQNEASDRYRESRRALLAYARERLAAR
jgi:glycosyltransferase involved in cell wall biosynthesis